MILIVFFFAIHSVGCVNAYIIYDETCVQVEIGCVSYDNTTVAVFNMSFDFDLFRIMGENVFKMMCYFMISTCVTYR